MTEKQNTTIVLIDDQAIVRAAFKSLLERNAHFRVVGDSTTLSRRSARRSGSSPGTSS
jgi:DNA-binding NarL/FixJ family response regulator